MHLAAELAAVAKAIGPNRPVKLVWTREDDLRGGYYRPLFVHRLRGAVRDGKIVAWANTVVGQSFLKGTPFEAMVIKDGIDADHASRARASSSTRSPTSAARCTTAEVGVPTLWWRSVGHTHTGYAVECFVDELLQAAGQDPVTGRLAMMGKAPRAAGVLRAVAELARWTGPGPVNGRARGVAVVESFGSFVAQIAEVSAGDGEGPRVHKVWCAVDCGVAVNPDVIRAQMEGGIGFGLGHALYAEVDARRGPAGAGQLRHLPLAAHPRDAGGRGDDRALDREADRRRRARRAADRPGGRQRPGALGLQPAAAPADGGRDGVMMRTPSAGGGCRGHRRCSPGQRCSPLGQTRRVRPALATELRPVASFAGIADTQSRSIALFEEAGKVLQHPRCVNCHPGRRPAAPGRPHAACTSRWSCAARTATARPAWPARPATAAPTSIRRACRAIRTGTWRRSRWPGRASRSAQICKQLKDPARNGSRDIAAILKHATTDSLVKWGWNPGPGRTPAPGTNAEFGALLQAWADAGAYCPAP